MKALILAAGRGSRLNALTEYHPKSFVKIWGKRIIEWTLTALNSQSFNDVAIVTGYKRECFADIPSTKIHNDNWETTNMVYSMSLALDWIGDDDCAIIYSDIIFDPRYLDLLRGRRNITVLSNSQWLPTWKERMENPLSDAETFITDAHGNLIDIGQKPNDYDQIQGQYMGLVALPGKHMKVLRNAIRELGIPKLMNTDFTSFLRWLLSTGVKIETVSCPGNWIEIDNVSDFQLYSGKPTPQFLKGALSEHSTEAKI